MSARTYARARPQKSGARPVSRPGDRHEREAERAADVVARGGSVSNWSFSAVPTSAPEPVQRQQVFIEKTDEQKKQEATSQTIEAIKETRPAKALKDKVMADPVVKAAKEAVTSTPGTIAAGAAVAGGVGALAATGKPLPVQPPKIPIKPGVSAELKYEGPVNAPTYVGVTVTLEEQAAKGKKTPPTDPIAADIARLKAQQEMFKPEEQKAAERKKQDELVQAWITSRSGLAGLPSATIPLKGTPKGEEKPREEAKKEEEKTPVQRAQASPAAAQPALASVDDALSLPGRPIDPGSRRTMEARFGYDFSSVRLHDDARAAATAKEMDAAAFTVGDDIAFGSGRYDPSTPVGQRLLAHELAHVVQQGPPRTLSGSSVAIKRSNGLREREADVTSEGLVDAPYARLELTPAPRHVQRQRSEEVEVEVEAPTPEEREQLRSRGLELPRVSPQAADPRTRDDYVDRRMESVEYGIYLGGFLVHCTELGLPIFVSNAYLDTGLTNATSVSPSIYQDRASAFAAIPAGPLAPGQPQPYAFHRVPGTTVIVPTVFSPATTPQTIRTLLEAQRELARQVQHELTVMALQMIGGAVLKLIVKGLVRVFKRSGPRVPPSLEIPRKSADELVRAAKARGEPVVVNIGGAGRPHEPPNAINLNNQAVSRRGIPNLVEADGADIGHLFKPGSVDRIEGHNMAPGVVDWSRGAAGAYNSLRPGGTFQYYYRGANLDAAVLGKALRAAGFRDVEVIADVLVKAVK
jgi:Domain of unknown function (DUF4157)